MISAFPPRASPSSQLFAFLSRQHVERLATTNLGQELSPEIWQRSALLFKLSWRLMWTLFLPFRHLASWAFVSPSGPMAYPCVVHPHLGTAAPTTLHPVHFTALTWLTRCPPILGTAHCASVASVACGEWCLPTMGHTWAWCLYLRPMTMARIKGSRLYQWHHSWTFSTQTLWVDWKHPWAEVNNCLTIPCTPPFSVMARM